MQVYDVERPCYFFTAVVMQLSQIYVIFFSIVSTGNFSNC